MKKLCISVCAVLSMLLSICVMTVGAASSSIHMVMGIGRTSVIVANDNSVKTVSISSADTDPNAMFCTPVSYDSKVYVPLRYVMETAGFNVNWDNDENAITISDRSETVMWVPDGGNGYKTVKAEKVLYGNNSFKLISKNGVSVTVPASPALTYLDRTYIALEDLEMFGFMIYHDVPNNLVHIMKSTTSSSFEKSFKEYVASGTEALKSYVAADYYESVNKGGAFADALEKYTNRGTANNNALNNSLALKLGKNLALAITDNPSEKNSVTVAKGARQLTYASTAYRDYVYFVNSNDKKLYRAVVTSGKTGSTTKVDLPDYMKDKSISQINIVNDRIFFIGYDNNNPKDGGYVYMAFVGNEKNSLVKVTANKVWNIYISNDYKLYYTNFDSLCTLYSIDLKDFNIINALCAYPQSGVWGSCELNNGIQFIAFDSAVNNAYCYTDLDTGAIISVKDGYTSELIKSDGNALYNFLNICSTENSKILYYIEYPNGRIGGFNSCKVASYNMLTGEKRTIYSSDKMLMELTVIDGCLYCTDSEYSALYKINITDSSVSLTVIE